MNHKTMIIVLRILFIVMIIGSCSESNTVVEPKEAHSYIPSASGYRALENASWGSLHNSVLNELNARVPLLGGGKISKEKYIKNVCTSTNTVFQQKGIDIQITSEDVMKVITLFAQLKEEDVIDFFTPPSDVPEKEFANFIRKGLLSKDEAASHLRVFQDLKNNGKISDIHKPLRSSTLSDEGGSCVASRFVEIAEYSYSFWTGLHELNMVDSIGPGPDDGEVSPEKMQAIALMYWDAFGALAGALAAPPFALITGFVGLVIASTVFIIYF